MNINKKNAMLLDIQYIKANRREKQPDYLYIIWKDLVSGEKKLEAIPEPMMNIYFTKPEYRNHSYNKDYEVLSKLEKTPVKYKDIVYAIANDIGDAGKERLQQCFNTGDYRGIREMYIYPYVYGADYDIRSWYRYEWLRTLSNDKPKTIRKGFADIEVDGLEAPGLPDPSYCPVDLVTLIDSNTLQSYTFCLTGVDCKEKDTSLMNETEKAKEYKRREMYRSRMHQQESIKNNIPLLQEKAHEMFDENYPGMNYNFYFYTDERKMLVHIFQLINQLKLDFIGFWNASFDMPYLKDRCVALGLDPKEVMCHPDFPVKECWFKHDSYNFQIKNNSDFFHISSYTIFYCQMRVYAAIRKGQQELRSNKLNFIAQKELKDEKYNYSESGNIKTVSYNNYLMYILYNIKDVLLQHGIEKKTSDVDNYYATSYMNMTPYESTFKQTIKLRNVQYKSYMEQGLVPGENVNSFIYSGEPEPEDDDDDDEYDDDDTPKKKKDDKFEGALVGNPKLIGRFGKKMYGVYSNSVFRYSIDFDMSRFYPSTIGAMNLCPSALIFKVIMDSSQYSVRGGDLPFNGITNVQLVKDNNDTFEGDISKEVFDNFQTRNYLSTGHKWMNMPSVNKAYERLKERLG